MKHFATILIFFWALGYAQFTLAKDCSRKEAIQAETESSTLPDWDSVYKAFRRFAHCDSGAIGEGYSESVGRLLAKDWVHLERLRILSQRDKGFERFVIRHINETLPLDYLQQIIVNTRQYCPQNARRICDLIETAAKEAQEETKPNE